VHSRNNDALATLDYRLCFNEETPLLIVVNAKNASGNYDVPGAFQFVAG
jgi:hypothetical protein